MTDPAANGNTLSEVDPRKARLFGEVSADPLQKQLIKARLLHDPIVEPVRVGRYAILRRLGRGGMGVVYVGYDEELDRRVAIKLLHHDLATDERRRTGILREAQALARLSHPNVVQVYEVGHCRGQDFVAMEYVDGTTLDRWLAASPRTLAEVLEQVGQAGRGLAAAHAAGLVHRDFKPANILIGRLGRARVVDFGLARSTVESNSDCVTERGNLIGTPVYMAPEQHRGGQGSPLSDQFSFCVVLYEAVYGHRPFAADRWDDYVDKVARSEVEPAPSHAKVPTWLRRVIVRGLAAAPEQRWPSIDALLAELRPAPKHGWRRLALGVGVLASCALGLARLGDPEPDVCTNDPSSIADTWGPDQHRAVDAAFERIGPSPETARVLAQTRQSLDAYADALVSGRTAACSARWLTHAQTDGQLELRSACLEQRERELRAVVEILADADTEVVLHATELVAGLGDIELCAQVELLGVGTPTPKDAGAIATIATVGEQIAEANVARAVGRIADAERLLAGAWLTANELGFAPLIGELHVLEARIARTVLDSDRARVHLGEAAAIAQRSHDVELAAEAWTQLAGLAAITGVDPDTSLEFELATASVEQLGNPPRYQAMLELARAHALVESGRHHRAVPILDRAITDAELEPSAQAMLGPLWMMRSRGLAALGRMPEARADLDRAVSARGTRTRDQLDALFDLGVLELEAGEVEQAERDIEAAIRGYVALFGPRFTSVAHGHLALANIALLREQTESAEAHCEAALALLGPDHVDRDWALDGLASAQMRRGQAEAAQQTLRDAIAHRARLEPDDHERLGYLEFRLGVMLRDSGRLDEALLEFDRALLRFERPELALPLDRARALSGRGETLLRQGHARLAAESLELAVELTQIDCGDAVVAGEARVLLAWALHELGERPDQQRELARAGAELIGDYPSHASILALATDLAEAPR